MSEQAPLLKDQPPPGDGPPLSGHLPYQTTPQPSGPTIITTQPVIISTMGTLRDIPVCVQCPNCRRDVTTRIEYEPGLLTWLLVGIICIFGFWCGCCLIPLFLDSMQDAVHICPNCNYTIGKYKRLQ